MATVGSAKSTLVDKINSLTAAATPKDTIFLAKALGEATSLTNFVWQGTWTTGTEYAIDDVVIEGVSSYVCIQAHTAGATFAGDSSKWDAIAVGANVPDQTGNSGKVLKTDGSTLTWGDGLPTGGTAGQIIETDGSDNYSWVDKPTGKILSATVVYNSNSSNYFSNQSGTQLYSNTYYPIGARIGGSFTKVSDTSKLLVTGHISLYHTNTNLHDGAVWCAGYESNYVSMLYDVRAFGWYQHSQGSSGTNYVWDFNAVLEGVASGTRSVYMAPSVNGTRTHTHQLNPNPQSNSVYNFGDTNNRAATSMVTVLEFE